GLPVRSLERRRVPLVGAQFAYVGPKIDIRAARLEAVLPRPVIPPAPAAVPLGRVPPLIAAHHLPCQGRAVNALRAGPLKRLHRLFDDLFARQLLRLVRRALSVGIQKRHQHRAGAKRSEKSTTPIAHDRFPPTTFSPR